VHLVGFIIKKSVTMHGHVYVKIVMYAVLINYILFVAIVANA